MATWNALRSDPEEFGQYVDRLAGEPDTEAGAPPDLNSVEYDLPDDMAVAHRDDEDEQD